MIKDRLPAYISWATFERNVRQMESNGARAMGVPRRGPSMLAGLLHCGRCNHRMATTYGSGRMRYNCAQQAVSYAQPLCQSLAGRVLDEKVAELVLRALEPAALEVSLRVAEDIESERQRLEATWCKRLERAAFEVARARRQYDAVEPENRLVARTLERQLEEKLAAEQTLNEEHDRFIAEQPTLLSAEERNYIRSLASDIPALWSAESTTAAERQTIVRQLIDRIIVLVDGNTERVNLEITWVGGHKTKTVVTRPVARLDQLSYYDELVKRVHRLREQGLRFAEIAERLNAEGWHPPKRRPTFNAQMLYELAARGRTAKARRSGDRSGLRRHEWRMPELAAALSMPVVTLYSWLCRGWVRGRRLDEPRRPWALFADTEELARLRALRQAPKLGWRAQTERMLGRA